MTVHAELLLDEPPPLISQVEAALADSASLITTDPQQALELSLEAAVNARRLGNGHLVAASLHNAGLARSRLDQMAEALETLLEASAAYESVSRPFDQARCLERAAAVQRRQGNLDEAAELAEKALGLSRRDGGSSTVEADVLNTLAGIKHALGDYAGALDLTYQTLRVRRKIDDRDGEVQCLSNLGLIYTGLGDYPQALENLTEAHRVVREFVRDERIEVHTLVNIGLLFENINEHQQALDYYENGLEIARRINDRTSEAICLLNASNVLQHLDRTDAAVAHLSEALQIGEEIGFGLALIRAHQGLGQAHEREGQLDAALDSLHHALEIARSSDDFEGQVGTLLAMGPVYLKLRDYPAALDAISQGLELAEGAGLKREVFEAHEKLADAYRLSGDPASALEHYVEFHRLEREIFNDESERKTRVLAIQFEVEKSRREAEFYRLRTEIESQAREDAEAKVRERTLELEAAQIEVVTRLAVAAEYRDDQTGDHTRRVGSYSALIARELGLPETEVELVRLAARLHDVGKIGTPDAILLKPGKLTLEEFRTMESHAAIGARILSGGQSRLLRAAEEIALSHHERWDGRGYPRGLSGEEIPLFGRIVSVADVFDALTSERPYKRAWTPGEALEEILRQAGCQFDPRVVDAASKVLTPELIARADLTSDKVNAPDGHAIGEAIAYVDSETGLGNGAAFDSDLDNELLRGARRGYTVRIVTVKVEGEGDPSDAERLDRLLGAALHQRLRSLGRAYRVKGGSYAAILTSGAAGPEEARRLLEEAVASVPWEAYPAFRALVSLQSHPPDEADSSDDGPSAGGGAQ